MTLQQLTELADKTTIFFLVVLGLFLLRTLYKSLTPFYQTAMIGLILVSTFSYGALYILIGPAPDINKINQHIQDK